MNRQELMKYEKNSVRINYSNRVGDQSRTGFVYSVTQECVIFWPFEIEDEVPIPFKDINGISTNLE